MIINHNMPALNTYNKLTTNNSNASKALEKLSSGLRINKAGDDAAGLAISEKMRAQIRGLDQASRNSQDGISMIQTAEGGLTETHSILQRMRELATQSASDTNVGVDRNEIQKEMNQLSSEINRIGNTTEFNTQKVLAGDSKVNVARTGLFTDKPLAGGLTTNNQVTQTSTMSAATDEQTAKFTINGQDITVTFAASGTNAAAAHTPYSVTSNSASVNIDTAQTADETAAAVKSALEKIIAANDTLRGNFTVANATAGVTIAATPGGAFAGSAGNIAPASGTTVANAGKAAVGTTVLTAATTNVDLGTGAVSTFVGKGITINDQSIEFYDGSKGAYTGNAIGVDLAGVTAAGGNGLVEKAIADQIGTKLNGVTLTATANNLVITATQGGTGGNAIKVEDGGINKQFKATLQVGANQGQQMTLDINDMRAGAIGVTSAAGQTDNATGAKFVTSNNVTNGTDTITREAALDVSSATNATNAIKTINNSIEKVSAERSKLGAFQNRLEHTIANLGTSSENLTAAESRVRDVDMAKEMMNFQKNNILSQAAQAMLAQANQAPQGVLQLLR